MLWMSSLYSMGPWVEGVLFNHKDLSFKSDVLIT